MAAELKEDPHEILKRCKRTGGQIRDFIREERYAFFKGQQDNAWLGIQSKDVIHFGDLKGSATKRMG